MPRPLGKSHSGLPASLNATSQVPSGALANFEEVWQKAAAVPLGSRHHGSEVLRRATRNATKEDVAQPLKSTT